MVSWRTYQLKTVVPGVIAATATTSATAAASNSSSSSTDNSKATGGYGHCSAQYQQQQQQQQLGMHCCINVSYTLVVAALPRQCVQSLHSAAVLSRHLHCKMLLRCKYMQTFIIQFPGRNCIYWHCSTQLWAWSCKVLARWRTIAGHMCSCTLSGELALFDCQTMYAQHCWCHASWWHHTPMYIT